MAEQTYDKPAATAPDEPNNNNAAIEKITIYIREGGGDTTGFTMNANGKMKKMFKAYADRKGIPLGGFRFVTQDGQNVSTEVTPKYMGMEDNEVLDVLAVQVGGGQ